jgi:hypothetical protein
MTPKLLSITQVVTDDALILVSLFHINRYVSEYRKTGPSESDRMTPQKLGRRISPIRFQSYAMKDTGPVLSK